MRNQRNLGSASGAGNVLKAFLAFMEGFQDVQGSVFNTAEGYWAADITAAMGMFY